MSEDLEVERKTLEKTAVVKKPDAIVRTDSNKFKSEMNKSPEKTKEEILVERHAKKVAKQSKKSEGGGKEGSLTSPVPSPSKLETSHASKPSENSKELILAERAAKNLAKQSAKKHVDVACPSTRTPQNQPTSDLAKIVEKLQIDDPRETPGKKVLSKAERRAIQEAQRSAKAKVLDEKNTTAKKIKEVPAKRQDIMSKKLFETPLKVSTSKPSTAHKVKLFKHLYTEKCDLNMNVNQKLHPAIVKLGLQYANDAIVGSNARCYAFLNAMRIVSAIKFGTSTYCQNQLFFQLVNDYVTPPEKLFCRGLEAELVPAIAFLQNCRPLAVSMTNALKYIKLLVSQEDSCDNDDDVSD